MKSHLRRFVLLAVLLTLGAALMPCELFAQQAAQAKSYDAFRGMRTRNIFDPDRRGPRVESAPSRSYGSSSRPDSFALTGTMVTEGKTLAFFSGSRSDYNKVLPVQGKIADYTVTNITSSHVALERNGTPVTLPVGKQISMDGSGRVSANTGTSEPARLSDPSTTSSDAPQGGDTPPAVDTAPPAGVPADKAEILRRMMERRQQETSR